ncbi:MAG: cyanophycinase [Leptolyngbya sp. IPPAS B-1204]|nr:cyanophycinase [Elainella sp. C42_A2020_010]
MTEPLTPEVSPLPRPKGPLVIIGGAEERDGEAKILRAFIQLAGGRSAQIVVLTAATSEPIEAGETYIEVFKRLGAKTVWVVDTRDPDDANQFEAVWAIRQASGIFFTGGDQARIVERIKGTILEDAIQKRHSEGAVIAGTSAGAAIMPEVMIVRGESETSPRNDAVMLGAGMGFVSGMVVDQHFAQRGRLGRLLTALVLQPSIIGVGVDENTALIVKGDEFEVLGEGAVTIVDESELTYKSADFSVPVGAVAGWHRHSQQVATGPNQVMSVFDIKLHILAEGCRFNLKTRQPSAAE